MKSIRIYCIMVFLFFVSCETRMFTGDVDCDECYTDQFTQADIVIKLNAFDEADFIWFEVYQGKVGDGSVFFADTALYTNEYFLVNVNEDYAARAVYHFGNDSIIAVDGTTVRRRLVIDFCDEDCYIVENEVIDLRLDGYE